MSTPSEIRFPTKALRRWYGIFLLLLVAILAGTGAFTLWEWKFVSPMSRKREFPRLSDFLVENFASAARERHCWLARLDEEGNLTQSAENESGSFEFSRLVRALLPIRDDKPTDPVEPFGPVYQITILTGNRGVQLRVRCTTAEDRDDLLIEYHGQRYTGGSSFDFQAAIKQVPLQDTREIKTSIKQHDQDG